MSDNSHDAARYLHDHREAIHAERLRSVAILEALFDGAALYARLCEKHPITKVSNEDDAQVDLRRWADLDAPLPNNILGRLPFPAEKTAPLLLDLDVDVDPVPGEVWTEITLARAKRIVTTIMASVRLACGQGLHVAFGRVELGGHGHLLLSIERGSDKLILDRLRGLRMRKAIVVAGMQVRYELRFCEARDKLVQVCLPGSVHRSLAPDASSTHVRWAALPTPPERPVDSLIPCTADQLALGLYGGLLQLLVQDAWSEGQRHELALVVSGVLAREVQRTRDLETGSALDDNAARALMDQLTNGDDEKPLRLRLLEDSLGKVDSRNLPGYPRLQEFLGESAGPVIKLLRRLLGGADYTTYDDLITRLVVVLKGGTEPKYVDLGQAGEGLSLNLFSKAGIQAAHQPAVVQKPGGKIIPAVDLVLRSPSRQQVDQAIDLPGVERGKVVYILSNRICLEDPALDGTATAVNLSPGYATPIRLDPPPQYLIDRFRDEIWLPQLEPITRGNPHHILKITQVVAWIVRYPTMKPQFGLILTGGQGIGKSSLFEAILRPILGACVMVTNAQELFGRSFAFNAVPGAKLLVIEEADFRDGFGEHERQLVKQLNRSEMLEINRKYGVKGLTYNMCVPVYLTNAEHPSIASPGASDRTQYQICGHTMRSLDLGPDEWLQEVVNPISKRVAQAHFLLTQHPEAAALRAAAMWCFANTPVTLAELTDITHSDANAAEYREAELSREQQVICEMLERGYLHPYYADKPLEHPFPGEVLTEAFNELWCKFGGRALPSAHVFRLVREVLGDHVLEERNVVVKPRPRWFAFKRGTLAELFYKRTGVRVVTGEDEQGRNYPHDSDIEAAKKWKATKA